jgi:hypothetical protein
VEFATFGVEAEQIPDGESNVSPQSIKIDSPLAPANIRKYINHLLLTKIDPSTSVVQESPTNDSHSKPLDSTHPHTFTKRSEQDTKEDNTQLTLDFANRFRGSTSVNDEKARRKECDPATPPDRLSVLRQQLTAIEKLGLESFNARRRANSRNDSTIVDNLPNGFQSRSFRADPIYAGYHKRSDEISEKNNDLKIKNRSLLGQKRERDTSVNSRDLSGMLLLDRKAQSAVNKTHLGGHQLELPLLQEFKERASLFMTTPESKPVHNFNLKERKKILRGSLGPDDNQISAVFRPEVFQNQICGLLGAIQAPRLSLSTGKADRPLLHQRYHRAHVDASLELRPISSVGAQPFYLDSKLGKDHVLLDSDQPDRQSSVQFEFTFRPSTPLKVQAVSPPKTADRYVKSASISPDNFALTPQLGDRSVLALSPINSGLGSQITSLPTRHKDMSPPDLYRVCRSHLNEFAHSLVKMQKDFNEKLQQSLQFEEKTLRVALNDPCRSPKTVNDLQKLSSEMSRALQRHTDALNSNTTRHHELTDLLEQIETEVRRLEAEKCRKLMLKKATSSSAVERLFDRFKASSTFIDIDNKLEADNLFDRARAATVAKRESLAAKLGMESSVRPKEADRTSSFLNQSNVGIKQVPITLSELGDLKLIGLVNSIREKHNLQEAEVKHLQSKCNSLNSEFRKVHPISRTVKDSLAKHNAGEEARESILGRGAGPKSLRTEKATIDQLLSGLRIKKNPRAKRN